MNTLDDLRGTLDQHASGLHDAERYARPVAVRARVRTVRRRRAGIAAVAAAVVLLTGVATMDALRTPRTVEPADRVVAGVDVPARIRVLDFPYALLSVRSLADSAHLQPSDHEQAVVLAASDLGTGSATLYADGQAVARVRGDQQVAAPYPIGNGGTGLQVRLSGAGPDARAGVAIYEATGATASGVTHGSAVFRDRVAGATLAGAVFSDDHGAATASVDVPGRLDRLGLSHYCRTDEEGLWVQVSVDGDGAIGSSCSSAAVDDAGPGWSTLDDHTAGTHHVEVYLTRGPDGPRVSTGATVGIGIYSLPPAAAHLLGMDVEPTVEAAGRTWVIDRVVDGDHAVVDTGDADRLLGFLGEGSRTWVTYRGDTDRGQSSSMGSGPGSGAGRIIDTVLLAGDRYDVRLHTAEPTGAGALLVYRPQ